MNLLHVNYTLAVMVIVVAIIIVAVPSKDKARWCLVAVAFTESFTLLKSSIKTSMVM